MRQSSTSLASGVERDPDEPPDGFCSGRKILLSAAPIVDPGQLLVVPARTHLGADTR
ncbi:hypothetical protein [Hyphomicrobium sp. 1Nfss2.1]|uniref:hypothetical protein n=1 Tax=Hyphomicrobium sp. 1Nfss2.1 TaxID=3413936 RepID=UPI003C7BED7A